MKHYPSIVLGSEDTDTFRSHRACGFVGETDSKPMSKSTKSVITDYVIKKISRMMG